MENQKEVPKETAMLVINAEKISDLTGFKADEIAVIHNTIAKGTTLTELSYFLSVCKTVHLNPFMKEIWCYKDGKGNVLVFAGRDGFLRKAQDDKLWNGMLSFEVCENDEFEMSVHEAKVLHKPNFKNRGAIIGAYAIIKPKGCELPTIEWAEMKTYDKGYSVWKSDPASMIKKVAETHALKKAFGISGLNSEYDFEIKDDVAVPLNHESEIDKSLQSKVIVEIPEVIEQAIADASPEELVNIFNGNRDYHSNPRFMQLLTARKTVLNGNSFANQD